MDLSSWAYNAKSTLLAGDRKQHKGDRLQQERITQPGAREEPERGKTCWTGS